MAVFAAKRNLAFFLVSLGIYALCVVVYGLWYSHERTLESLEAIDKRLLLAAQGLPYLLPPDFHDRAVDENSISLEEELKHRRAFSDFALQTEFKWLYTLTRRDGRFYFSAPTVTPEEAKERKRWYFYPYEDIPDDFTRAYDENRVMFSTYSDQWGHFRSIALPRISPGGKKYLSCADLEITHIQALKKKNLIRATLTAIFFLLLSIPFILSFRLTFRTARIELENKNKELSAHRDHLEVLVEARTADLKNEKEKAEKLVVELEQAMRELKTLGGLLPICSACKKIRDDQGYWHQVEAYIEDHTQAEFSHSLCPECLDQLFPNRKPFKKR
ncbi:MAG: hypothetical protein V1816_10955 [Pseudomonadota bacterium]